jgi:hypothetical protein
LSLNFLKFNANIFVFDDFKNRNFNSIKIFKEKYNNNKYLPLHHQAMRIELVKAALVTFSRNRSPNLILTVSKMSRPLVSVYDPEIADAVVSTVTLPAVFTSPIRSDVVHYVHTLMAKNKRQAYAVSEKAGHQTPAESWGTGRAVARIPRVPGGGTSRYFSKMLIESNALFQR